MILPEVYAAGFPRCGTTWMGKVLAQHPEINVPLKHHQVYPYLVKKEIHYFNKHPSRLDEEFSPNLGFNRNITEYIPFFEEGKINIDFSICSAYDLETAKRVKDILGDVKILFFVRDEIQHRESIKTLIGVDKEYLHNFEKYIEPFRIFSNLLIVNLEETKKNPKEQIRKILKFIGVKDINFEFNLNEEKHSSDEIIHWRNNEKLP